MTSLPRAGLLALTLAAATLSHAQAETKKELAQKVVQIQRPGIENIARAMAEQPAVQVMQNVRRIVQTQLPPEKREAAGKAAEAEVRKFLDDAIPMVRDKALQLAPSTMGATLEEKFSEDELKQLIAWLDSPLAKKYQQLTPEILNSLTQKLVADIRPQLEAKIKTMDTNVGKALGLTPPPAANGTPPASAPKTR